MSNFLILFGVIKLMQYLFNSISNDLDKSSAHSTNKIKHQYIFNNKIIDTTFLMHAYTVLDLNPNELLTPHKIHQAYCKQLQFFEEDIILGYQTKYISEDLDSARDYLLNYFDYVHCLN